MDWLDLLSVKAGARVDRKGNQNNLVYYGESQTQNFFLTLLC